MAEATRRRAAGGLVVVCAAQFVTGVDGLFVAGSPVVGLATATGPLVAARTVQGIGAALAVPATLALIGRYATDVLPALLVFGVSAAVGFVILTGQAVADVGPDEQGVASGCSRPPTTWAAARPRWPSTPP